MGEKRGRMNNHAVPPTAAIAMIFIATILASLLLHGGPKPTPVHIRGLRGSGLECSVLPWGAARQKARIQLPCLRAYALRRDIRKKRTGTRYRQFCGFCLRSI